MPRTIEKATIDSIEKAIKDAKEITKTDVLRQTKANFYSLNTVLDNLQKAGKIVIIKQDRVVKDKIISTTTTLKWADKRK